MWGRKLEHFVKWPFLLKYLIKTGYLLFSHSNPSEIGKHWVGVNLSVAFDHDVLLLAMVRAHAREGIPITTCKWEVRDQHR